MLRSKGFTDKMILLGIDGMDPRFTRRLLDEGKLPNIRKLMELGACREDLVLLGAVPTVTPPMWATLATGEHPENYPELIVRVCGFSAKLYWGIGCESKWRIFYIL